MEKHFTVLQDHSGREGPPFLNTKRIETYGAEIGYRSYSVSELVISQSRRNVGSGFKSPNFVDRTKTSPRHSVDRTQLDVNQVDSNRQSVSNPGRDEVHRT